MTQTDGMNERVYEQILSVARRLATSSDLDVVLGMIIDALRDTLHAERASVFQYDLEHHELFATRAHGLPSDLRLCADLGIIGEAARTRRIINIPDAYADSRFNREVDRATGFHTRCLLTIPLIDHENRLVGVAQVLNKSTQQGGVFTEVDERIAAYLADQAAVALKRAALLDAERIKEKLESDLAIARRIQFAALPAELPELPGYELAGSSIPAEQTGGDAFDVIPILPEDAEGGDAESILVFMADATGHGVGPALSVTQVISMLRMAVRIGTPLQESALHINQQLCNDLPIGRFVTAFIGELDRTTNTMSYTSAGQAPIVLVRAGNEPAMHLPANGMPFGIDAEFECDRTEPIPFHPGDVFVLLSDGYYEAQNDKGGMLGYHAVVDVVRRHMAGSASEILVALREAVDQFAAGRPADDDQTAIVIKRLVSGDR